MTPLMWVLSGIVALVLCVAWGIYDNKSYSRAKKATRKTHKLILPDEKDKSKQPKQPYVSSYDEDHYPSPVLFIAVLIGLTVSGCATTELNTPTIHAKYTRLFNQELVGKMIVDNDGTLTVEFNQKSLRDKELYSLAGEITSAAVSAAVKGAAGGL